MLSCEQIEEVIPWPVKIEICCSQVDFSIVVQDSFTQLLEEHNKNYTTKIEYIPRHFVDLGEHDMEFYDCRILVGKEVVHFIKGPDLYGDIMEDLEKYFKSIVDVTRGVLTTWHDRIIEVQNENQLKLEQLEDEENYEILYGYYAIRCDFRSMRYLKKLAFRYQNSEYMRKLCRIIRNGTHGWHERNPYLADKLRKRHKEDVDF